MKTEATPEAPPEANREDARPAPVSVLSLPLLHRDSVAEGWRTKAPHLWPGLPQMPATGYIELAEYPFSPKEALACLTDLEAMSRAALSGVPLQALVAQENRPLSVRDLEEQADLRRFASTGGKTSADDFPACDNAVLRKAAHKALLWAWLLEERQREVRDLSSNFDSNASHLMDALGVEEDTDFVGLRAMDMQLIQDAGIVPPWKLVVQNAAFFLPDTCTLVVNDACMAEAVAESSAEHHGIFEEVDTSIRTQWGLPTLPDRVWIKVVLPLWKVVGLNAPSSQLSRFSQLSWLDRTAQIMLPVPDTFPADKGAA